MKKRIFALILAAVMVLSIGTTSFAASGAWQYDGYGWWYAYDGGGYPLNTWEQIDGSWYFFDGSGYMITGWKWDGTAWYYMNPNGAMATGWIYDSRHWYYMDPSGFMRTGWLEERGLWYYLNPDGTMATGWIQDGGYWYYMDPTGVMHTGWLNIGDQWYYLESSGVMHTSWLEERGVWYYMNPDGTMATSWVQDGNEWYYMEPSGIMHTGWLFDSGNWYYMDPLGYMVQNETRTIDGKTCVFNASGILISETDAGKQVNPGPSAPVDGITLFFPQNGARILPQSGFTMMGVAEVQFNGTKVTDFTFTNSNEVVVGVAKTADGNLQFRDLTRGNSEIAVTYQGNTVIFQWAPRPGGQDPVPALPPSQGLVEVVTSDGTQTKDGNVQVGTQTMQDGTTQDMVQVRATWVNNTKFYMCMIATFSGTPFTQAEIDDAIQRYPAMWKQQIPADQINPAPALTIGGGFPVEAGRGFNYNDYNKVYILLLDLDQNLNYVAHSIVTITK